MQASIWKISLLHRCSLLELWVVFKSLSKHNIHIRNPRADIIKLTIISFTNTEPYLMLHCGRICTSVCIHAPAVNYNLTKFLVRRAHAPYKHTQIDLEGIFTSRVMSLISVSCMAKIWHSILPELLKSLSNGAYVPSRLQSVPITKSTNITWYSMNRGNDKYRKSIRLWNRNDTNIWPSHGSYCVAIMTVWGILLSVIKTQFCMG